jgi:hypothetical protein
MRCARGKAGLWVILLLVLLGFIVIVGTSGEGSGTRPRSAPSSHRSSLARQAAQEMDEKVAEMIASGVIHSVDVEANRVRFATSSNSWTCL